RRAGRGRQAGRQRVGGDASAADPHVLSTDCVPERKAHQGFWSHSSTPSSRPVSPEDTIVGPGAAPIQMPIRSDRDVGRAPAPVGQPVTGSFFTANTTPAGRSEYGTVATGVAPFSGQMPA